MFRLIDLRRRPARRTLALAVVALEERCVPATLTVDGDGGKQFTTIQAAITAAGKNDTIKVYYASRGYTEALNVASSKTGLKLKAAEDGVRIKARADVTPDIVGGPSCVYIGDAILDVRATKVSIDGFTFDGSTNTDGELSAGIRVIDGGSATITDNTITGLTTSSNPQFGIGIQVGSSRGN